MTIQAQPTVRSRPGRPRTVELNDRKEHILRIASEAFLTFGFDGTSMDAIAASAQISKRTLYARYADKAALFRTVLKDLVQRWLSPINQFVPDDSNLDETLFALARYMATFAVQPYPVSVNRIVISEAQRWPEFGRLVIETARDPALKIIEAILTRYRNRFRKTNLEMASRQFMALTVDSLVMSVHMGSQFTAEEVDSWCRASVQLFLAGLLCDRI